MITASFKRTQHLKLPEKIDGPSKVKVGFPKSAASASNIQKAVWNEFGTKGSGKRFMTARGGGFGGPIPERPFMRNAIGGNKAKYQDGMATAAAKILRGEADMGQTLSKLGILAQGDIQSEITSLSSPPNSPTTIRLKGSSNPLIDSGEMRGAVTYQVTDD